MMDFVNKSVVYILTVVLAFSVMSTSLVIGGETSPQAEFLVAFANTLEEGLEPLGFSELLELDNPLEFYAVDEPLSNAHYLEEAEEILYELFGTNPSLHGFTPQNMLSLLRIMPGFNEVEELFTTQVILDILSLPGVDYIVMELFEEFLPDVEPSYVFFMASLAYAFGIADMASELLGDDLPAIELFAALDYVAGEGFVQKALEMDVNERFAFMGTALASLLVDFMIEIEYYVEKLFQNSLDIL
ncbi:MAG: hypothetical protein FWB74_07545 [Defluviitaleaceae bacterium]|nr:hypothetical protein [Defluviitaleaceae bacterium]